VFFIFVNLGMGSVDPGRPRVTHNAGLGRQVWSVVGTYRQAYTPVYYPCTVSR